MVNLTPVAYPHPIVAGADWDWKFLFIDDDTLEYFDWTVDEWEITVDIKNRNGLLLVTLANFGGPDGTITPQDDGQLALHLPAAVTAGMPLTRVYVNSTDTRIATWRNRGTHFFDLQAANLTEDYQVTPVSGSIVVQQPVTA